AGRRQRRSHRNRRHRYGVYGILRAGDAPQYAGEPAARTVGRRPRNRWLEATDASLTRLVCQAKAHTADVHQVIRDTLPAPLRSGKQARTIRDHKIDSSETFTTAISIF